MPKKGNDPSTEKVAKTSDAVVKNAPKKAKATTVKKPVKAKKPPAKTSKKKPNKKVVQPKITDEMFAKYFFKLSFKQFVELTKDWNDENLKVKIQMHDSYDAWLNYFKTLSPSQIRLLAQTGLDILPTEGYAALSRWHDIISNPSRIDKIHRSGLTTGKSEKTIVDMAKSNDRLGVLEAIRDQLALKLQQGAGARDAGQLSAQMMEVMTQIDIQTRKQAPKPETPLGSLMADMPDIKRKRPSKNGGGSRHTSFASRVTIEDVEK